MLLRWGGGGNEEEHEGSRPWLQGAQTYLHRTHLSCLQAFRPIPSYNKGTAANNLRARLALQVVACRLASLIRCPRKSIAETRDRTGDLKIFSLTLSQLSYRGTGMRNAAAAFGRVSQGSRGMLSLESCFLQGALVVQSTVGPPRTTP